MVDYWLWTLKLMILNERRLKKDEDSIEWNLNLLDPEDSNFKFLDKLLIKFHELFFSIADHTQRESLGIIVQYKVRVKLFMSPFGG